MVGPPRAPTADELGRVVDDVVADPGREILRQRPHRRAHAVLGGERVGARLREDQQRHGVQVVEIAHRPVILAADLDARHVAHPGDVAGGVGLDDDLAELLRRLQPSLRLHVELERLVRRQRRLVQDAGRDLHVLRPQRRHHVVAGHAVGGDPCPGRARSAWRSRGCRTAARRRRRQPRQLVLHVQGGVVRDVELVARAVRRDQVHDQQDVRRRLLHRDALALHVLRQPRQRHLDPVLRQHLGGVEVGAELEGDGDGELAVAGALAAHVQHVLHAVDLLLERRRHGLGDHRRRGAGIGRGDLDRRRRDLGILRDRQDEQRAEPDQRDEDAQHRGQDRPVDEDVGQAHGGLALAAVEAGWMVPAIGVTLLPGLARISPSMITRSVGSSPLRTTRSPLLQRPGLDRLRHHRAVRGHGQHQLLRLVQHDRGGRHQHDGLAPVHRQPQPSELARCEEQVRVGDGGAGVDGAAGAVDRVVQEIQRAGAGGSASRRPA